MSFDRLTPAETAVDVPLSFLFHPERLNRLDQQKTTVGFGADDLFATLIDSTWKQAERKGMEKQIQQQTRQVLLTYLLAASINSENSFGVRAAASTALSNLKTWLETMQKTAPAADKGFYALALERMKAPQDAKPALHAPIPPGAPIGCGE
jgi:hypothetical protein